MAIIGINQRIPLNLLEMALRAVLSDDYSRSYFAELAAIEYTGTNRIGKSVCIMSKLTDQNPLIDFLREHSEETVEALRYKSDRGVILSAMLIATYEFVYDMLCLFGKYFHVQQRVPTRLITEKLSDKYGSNRSLPNAMNAAIPMLIEAGFLKRPLTGFYEIGRMLPKTEIARTIYNRAFMRHNPNYSEEEISSTHPYYEFLN